MGDFITNIKDSLLNRGLSSTIMTSIQLAMVALWAIVLASAIPSGEWRQLWIILILILLLYGVPMLIYRQLTKKTQTVDVKFWGAYGLQWGTAEIEVEKTPEEKAADATFLENLFPLIPVMMFMVLTIFMTMSGEGNQAGPIGTALIVSIILSVLLYFVFKSVRHSQPTSPQMQIVHGVVKGIVFAPHTFFMVGSVIGAITGVLALIL